MNNEKSRELCENVSCAALGLSVWAYSWAGVALRAYAKYIHSSPDKVSAYAESTPNEVYVYAEHML